MIRLIFASIIGFHGAIHAIGFIKEWQLAIAKKITKKRLPSPSETISKMLGTWWMIAMLLLLATSIVYVLKTDWWWMLALIAIIISQVLIIFSWRDAKAGTIANIIIFIAIVAAIPAWNFNNMVNREINQMYSKDLPYDKTVISKEMLTGLPYPVQLWLTKSGIIGKENMYAVRLKQTGLMRTKPEQDKWINITATQYFTTGNPAFIWKANMKILPLITATGRDKFVEGKGKMAIKILSFITMADDGGEKIDEGALQRYLAEICWFPSAALSSNIKWQSIDSFSAKATLTYKGSSGTVDFLFNKEGGLSGCNANRFKGSEVNAVRELWQIRTTAFAVINGIRMPIKSDVTWKLKTGDFTWLKLEITAIEYNKPQLY